MSAYVLTGAPGAGKTALLRQLESDGYPVVEEAATDIIALEQARGCPEPWRRAGFPDAIVRLQRQREHQAGLPAATGPVFCDRSPVCTLALSRFLGRPVSALVRAEVDRVVAERVFEQAVFFVRSLGFVTPTAARRISRTDALAFEEVHERTYAELGFRLIDVPRGPVGERAALVTGLVRGYPRAVGRCDNSSETQQESAG